MGSTKPPPPRLGMGYRLGTPLGTGFHLLVTLGLRWCGGLRHVRALPRGLGADVEPLLLRLRSRLACSLGLAEDFGFEELLKAAVAPRAHFAVELLSICATHPEGKCDGTLGAAVIRGHDETLPEVESGRLHLLRRVADETHVTGGR